MPVSAPPEQGSLVEVRQRRFLVVEVQQSTLPPDPLRRNGARPQHLVTLASVDEEALGEEMQVVWELEPGARAVEKGDVPHPDGFDDPERLDAFLDAVRWGAASSADVRALLSPFRSGIEIEDYQLDPVVRAIQMPRVNLLIADDVGLGKTIEAGLVCQELILRHRGLWQGQSVLDERSVFGITPLLTLRGSVEGNPYRLAANDGKSFKGSSVHGMGFVLEPEEALALITKNPHNKDVLFPYLNGEDLNSRPDQSPSRWVINFHDWPLDKAEKYPDCMAIVYEKVKPERDLNNRKLRRERWWQFGEYAPGLYATIAGMRRVLVTAQTSRRWEPAFVPLGIVYSHTVVIFAMDTWAEYAMMQAFPHEEWRLEYGPSLRQDARYTPSDCFETFPFPESTAGLEEIGEHYYLHRQEIMLRRQEGLTKTYNRFHDPHERAEDIAALRALHAEMDRAVALAYGWDDLDLGHGFHQTRQGLRFTISEAARQEALGRLLALNHQRYAEEEALGLREKGGKGKKPRAARVGGAASGKAAEATVRAPGLFDEA